MPRLQQMKKHFVVSNGVGLKNIVERYSIVNAGKITVEQEAGLFNVRLPLLQ